MKYLITLIILTFMFSSCNFSYHTSASSVMKTKTINDVDFIVFNFMKSKKRQLFLNQKLTIENKLTVNGMAKNIEKNIPFDFLAKKIGARKILEFHIDSIDFNVQKTKTKIDFIYYIKVNNEKKTIVFELMKDNENWQLF